MPPARASKTARGATKAKKPAAASTRKRRSAPATAEPSPAPEADPDALEDSPEPAKTYTALQTAVSQLFQAAQKTTSSHRKLTSQLRSVHQACSQGTGVGEELGGGRNGEKAFCKEFMRVLSRVLVVPKKELVGDRCMRFADSFVKLLLEKDPPQKDENGNFVRNESYRFVVYFVRCLTPLLESKDKNVRYRAAQVLALLLTNSIPSFPYENEETTFRKLKGELMRRMQDKEAGIRMQASVGLIRLLEMGLDEDDESDYEYEDQSSILIALIETLQQDPSSEVRKAILFNLPASKEVIPYILERARDTDHLIRRSIYTRVLPGLGDFRHLTIGMREKLLRWGLTDRDDSVRAAARKMFNFKWIEDAQGDLLEVLERIHITASGQDDAKDVAMKGFWEDRKDVVENLTLDNEFWENLTPESAFLARSFHDYCREQKLEALLEEKMPEITRLAFHLSQHLTKLIELIRANGEEKEITEEDFICEQLLLISSSTDYGDELGRRKMFTVMRDILAILELPDNLTRLVVDVLARISPNEMDFCMVIAEVIALVNDELLEDQEEEKGSDDESELSFHSANDEIGEAYDNEHEEAPARKKRKVQKTAEEEEEEKRKALHNMGVNLKLLFVAQCMLENVQKNLLENSHLVNMLNGLVVPAVRSHEAPIRELGIRCLGLSCLLDKDLAMEHLSLFAHCFNKGHEELQIEAVHIISDILMVHGALEPGASAVEQKTLHRMMAKALKLNDLPAIQSAVTEVVCKLMLAQVIEDEDLLKGLILAYFDPTTAQNKEVRQALNYFLPVYSHSSPTNQSHMQSVAAPMIHTLFTMYNDLHRDGPIGDDDNDMVSPATFSQMILEWTDPRRNVVLAKAETADLSGQAKVAIELLQTATGKCKDKERKLITSVLPKLHIDRKTPLPELQELYELISSAIEDGIAVDAVGRNALAKVEVVVGKLLSDAENGDDGGMGTGGGGKEDLEDETVMPQTDVEGERTEAERTDAERTDGEELASEMEVDDT